MSRRGPLWVLLLSGALGFWLGIAARPSWHTPIETAQVLAGLVVYPHTNPFFIYHVKLWSALHEILAVLLYFGASEITLSRVLSGLLGMLSFQALSGFIYAFSRSALLAIGATYAIFVSHAAEFGGIYPIHLLGTSHTYGVIGLSMSVLAAALLGNRMYRFGGLLLGALPALHPSMGLWTVIIIAIVLATDFTRLRVELRPAMRWFLGGAALAAACLVIHFAITPDIPRVDGAVKKQYLTALLEFWDGHRRPAHLNNAAVWLNAGMLPLSVVWLVWLRTKAPASVLFLLRFVAVSAAMSLAFTFASWLPSGWVPQPIQVMMPLRLLNVAAMLSPALLFGLIGLYWRHPAGAFAAVLLSIGLLCSDRSELWILLPGGMPRDLTAPLFDAGVTTLGAMAIVASGFTAIVWVVGRLRRQATVPLAEPRGRAALVLTAVFAMLTATVMTVTISALRADMPVSLMFRDRSHDPVFSTAAASEGMLLTGNALRLIQLRTRRPVLVDGGGLDGLAYALDAGPELNRILRDVYGVDLLNPPADGEGMWTASVPPAANRAAWERYTIDRWREIRRDYGVTQVLTNGDWELQLPVVVQTQEMRLYQID